MQLRRFPNGFIQLEGGVVTVGGGETVTFRAADVREVTARAGKKSLFSRNPPAVLEVSYAAGTDVVGMKMLVHPEDLAQAEAFAAALASARAG
jgi:hypothetical protein